MEHNSSMIDFVIIGSGVSGSRMAYELGRGGATCVLLEAGRSFNASTFPGNELDYSAKMFWGGGLEVSKDGRLGFLRAKCVGGTSIVNQALLNRFNDDVWDDWRQRTQIPFLTSQVMLAYYEAVEKELKVAQIPPKYHNKNAIIFIKAFNHLGFRWEPVRRAQGDCKLDEGSDCIVCLGGCPRNSKQSALVTTLRWAIEHGVDVRSEFEVGQIEHFRDHVIVHGYHHGQKTKVAGRRAVLAAGSFGNTALLIRSGFQKKLSALGKKFSCHPQLMTFALFDEPINAHKGALQAVESTDTRFRQKGVKLENVYVGPIGVAMLLPGYGKSYQSLMKRYRFMASIEVAVRDEPVGSITLDRKDNLVIHKPMTSFDKEKLNYGQAQVIELFQAVDAKEIVNSGQPFGLHLMGGCTLGTDPKTSVVSPEFKVHGYPNLIAADSSVFPAAPGTNPSFTIMALSLKAARELLIA
jgi:choline dehydrogenase-like flavoprotein